MLPKKHRLTKTADITITTAKGRSFFNHFFVIKSIKPTKITESMWAFVTSTKVSNLAVVRNRLKRVVRNEIYKNLTSINPGFYVLILKKTATTISTDQLRLELLKSLKKSKILKI